MTRKTIFGVALLGAGLASSPATAALFNVEIPKPATPQVKVSTPAVPTVDVPNTGDMQLREAAIIDKAGGLEKYIAMNATPESRIVWKHYQSKNGEPGFNPRLRAAANSIVVALQKSKGVDTGEKGLRNARLAALDEVPGLLDKGRATDAERAAFLSEAKRARAAWLATWAPDYVEPNKAAAAAATSAAADAKHVAEVVKANYYLDKLADEDRNKKNVETRKAKFNKLVEERYKPDEILGTYSTTRFWKGLPVFQLPEFKDTWSTIQEMGYKSYYVKNGTYYIVTGGFRQGVKKADVSKGSPTSEVEGYFPGLDAPVEVPAALIAPKFGK